MSALFVLLPFLGFYLGIKYQQSVTLPGQPLTNQNPIHSLTTDTEIFRTNVKPERGKIITYTVNKDDTLRSVAQKFDISENTIRWENNLASDTLIAGQILQILPVTGVSHIVMNGDTINSLAQKYHTDPQAIVDFPFNNFANNETYTLIQGEKLIIPNGTK